MMRESCGANDHPDSHLFIQIYRLISTYSLVQPPRGSNVSNSEIFDVLLKIQDIDDSEERKEQWRAQLDDILDRGCTETFVEATSLEKEHDYCQSEPSTYAISYIAGYVSRKAENRFAKFVGNEKQFTCNDCVSTLVLSKDEVIPESHKLIEIRSKGFLRHPSKTLTTLITLIENAVLSVVDGKKLDCNVLLNVTEELEKSSVPLIGCENHQPQLTQRIISFYLTTRMYFVAKHFNKNNAERKKIQEKRKCAKLVNVSESLSEEPQISLKKRRQRKNKKILDCNK